MSLDAASLQQRVAELTEKHQVPAASIAVLSNGEVLTAAAGILNIETGVEATPGSVFQIGSVTKAYTATLVMRLIEAGRLSLDEPVKTYLPGFRVADPDAPAVITPRHLLAHTSGIDGDNFTDTGRGDDALEHYLRTCEQSEQGLPPGTAFSYCNTGYGILGRMIEQVTGKTWDEAMKEHVLAPLGLQHSVTLAEEALRFRAAHGHVPGPEGRLGLAPFWAVPRSSGPAGGIISTAADVAAFAGMHLNGGVAADGTRFLSAESIELMRAPHVEVPDPSLGATHWGLGLLVHDLGDGRVVIGHDGGTVGQSAFLRWVPDRGVAVAVLANGGQAGALRDELLMALLGDLADVTLPPALAPLGGPLPDDAAQWEGVYERTNFRLVVEHQDAGLHGTVELDGLAAAAIGRSSFEGELLHAGGNSYVTRMLFPEDWTPVVFFRGPDGARYSHMAGRAQRHVEDTK